MANEITYKSKTSLALKSFFSLGMAHNAVVEQINNYIKTTGLNPIQFAIVDILGHKGALKISEIYAQMLIKSGNKTMILDSLEKKGLVKRIYSKNDRREIIIELTTTGQKFFNSNNKAYSEFVEQTISILSQADQKALIALLSKIYNSE